MISLSVVFTSILLLAYVILLIYYRQAWLGLPTFTTSPDASGKSTFVTVIIPARNEAKNIAALLDTLGRQSYPRCLYEVIVVDDHSTDNTAELVRQHSWVKLLQLEHMLSSEPINSYKKKAIEIAVQHGKGELIVTTDADCLVPHKWLSTIANFYEETQPKLMVMPVSINCGMRPIEIFQALDFMSLQGITGAAVHKKAHSMCNGANLAYTREAFNAVDGFHGIDSLASGDDMLLMHKIASRYPNGIAYVKSPDVIVSTEAVHTVKEFFNQRIRWASKASHYDDRSIFWVLLLVYLLNVCLLFLPVAALIIGSSDLLGQWLMLLLTKTAAELFFLYPVASFFNKERLLLFFPLAQPFHILYTVIAGWLGKFGSYSWKNRSVK